MAQINVNTEQLLKVASYIDGAGEDVMDYSNTLEQISSNVEIAWKSDSTKLYVDEMQIVEKNLKKLSGEASQLAGAIRNYVAEIKRIEQENAQKFNN
jgi:WXG100 family type VII secretion target